MREDGVDLGGAILQEFVGGEADGAASVGHVIDEDGDSVLDVTHQCHARHLVGLLTLLVDQGKLHVQPKIISSILCIYGDRRQDVALEMERN